MDHDEWAWLGGLVIGTVFGVLMSTLFWVLLVVPGT